MGHTFKDGKDRTWDIKITVDTVRRCRRLDEPIDINNILKSEVGLLDRLTTDVLLVADIAYCAIFTQAQEKGVTAEDFGASLEGDVIDNLTEVVLESIKDFTPNRRDRETLGLIIKKSGKAMEKARDLIESHINSGALDQEIDKQMELAKKELATMKASAAVPEVKPKQKKPTSSKSHTESPGASASTPPASPSES